MQQIVWRRRSWKNRMPGSRRVLVVLLAVLVGLGLLPAANLPASAHASYATIVPRSDGTGAILDANCRTGPGEYSTTFYRNSILYRPRFNWNPVQIHVLATRTQLYLCMDGLPRHTGSAASFVAVDFDVDHNGGRVADTGDLSFTIDENGSLALLRGDGAGGFVPVINSSGWTAVTNPGGEITWNVEYQIPLALIGGGMPLTTIGFHVRHNWLSAVGDDYAWPPAGYYNVPNTWGDLVFGAFPSGPGTVNLDVYRITQGLDYDIPAGMAYDLVAGKDTLVRAQLYTLGATRDITYSTCRVQQLTPVTGPVQLVPVSYYPAAPRINASPAGYFNDAPVFNCWVPGAMLANAATYRFDIQLGLAGSSSYQTVDLGTRTFRPTGDLRLLLYGTDFPSNYSGLYRPWDTALFGAVNEIMADFQRMTPLRRGTGMFNWSGTANPALSPGLRYFMHPVPYVCGATVAGETLDERFGRCDAESRQLAYAIKSDYNARLLLMDLLDGRHRDRFDQEAMLTAITSTGGGQAQFWTATHCSPGAGIDTNGSSGASATVVAQEVEHCFGQVTPGSPHYIPGGSNHSSTVEIATYRNQPLVNMITRQDNEHPVTVMHPSVYETYRSINEGYEWNNLRQFFTTMPRPAAPRSDASQSLFVLTGIFTPALGISVTYNARFDNLPLDTTPAAANSPYALIFYDAANTEIGRLPFQPVFSETHEAAPVYYPLYLTAAVPAGSVRVEIRNNTTLLYKQSFSQAGPLVKNVIASAPDGKGNVNLSWSASDSDSAELSYSIYFNSDPQAPPLLLVRGLTQTSYVFPTGFAPATPNGTLIVEASDGYNTGSATSNAFTIAEKPPVAHIVAPTTAANSPTPTYGVSLVAGQPATLAGSAYDFTGGPLAGKALSWKSSIDGDLGSGEQVLAKLSPGTHLLTLTATAPSGQTASDSVTVTVLANTSGDGLPDAYKAKYACLSVAAFESDQDPDGDGLTSLGEWMRGTDPCTADTDTDGFGDGDEARLGSNPLDAKSVPLPDLLFFTDDEVNLGMCPNPSSHTQPVQTNATANWTVTTGTPWLQVSGGGKSDGPLKIQANCQSVGQVPGIYTGQVLVSVAGGQFHALDVRVAVPNPIYLPLAQRKTPGGW